MTNINIKKSFLREENNPVDINITKEIQNLILKSKEEKFNIHVLRIFARILARIKSKQVHNEGQLILFNDEFLMDANGVVEFQFNYKDFTPKNYSSVNPVKAALDYLAGYGNKWHVIKNRKGETLDIHGSLILSPNINRNSKIVTFQMNAFWYNAFLNLTVLKYNKNMYKLYFLTESVNTIVFYNFLTTIPENGETTMLLNTFNEKFNFNFTKISEVFRTYLSRVKLDLDKNADISFNFSKNLKNPLKINIVRYHTNNIDHLKTEKQIFDSRIKSKAYYLKKKHKLSSTNTQMLIITFKNAGYDVLNFLISKNKKELNREVKGDEFIKLLSIYYANYNKRFRFKKP